MGLDTAYRAILRGHRLLADRAACPTLAGPWPGGASGHVRARYVGNCLGELDRLLHVLMDELAPELRVRPAPHQTNAANKIASLAAGAWTLPPDQSRLRALGRSRACFAHCQGYARRADGPGSPWMTAGWFAPATPGTLRRYQLGDRLTPDGDDLAGISLFYSALADRLMAIPSGRIAA